MFCFKLSGFWLALILVEDNAVDLPQSSMRAARFVYLANSISMCFFFVAIDIFLFPAVLFGILFFWGFLICGKELEYALK